MTSAGTSAGGAPDNFVLKSGAPNPFNPWTAIEYRLPEAGDVSLRVVTVSGRAVRTRLSEARPALARRFTDWFASAAARPIYARWGWEGA